jgi:hypothetical protein
MGTFKVHWDTGIGDWKTPGTVNGVFDGSRIDVGLPAAWVPLS